MQIKTASILIYNSSKVLGAIGHQTRGKFSGIGGKLEATDINVGYGVFRELLEELFDVRITTLPQATLIRCLGLIGQGLVSHAYPTHAIFMMSLAYLELILKELKAARVRSKFYVQFPITVTSLIKNRLPLAGEIIRLELLNKTPDSTIMSKEFIHDLALIQ